MRAQVVVHLVAARVGCSEDRAGLLYQNLRSGVTAQLSAVMAPSTPDKVVLHPLVLLSVVDHYNRVAKDTRKRVVGVLLGEVHKGVVDVTNSFARAYPPGLRLGLHLVVPQARLLLTYCSCVAGTACGDDVMRLCSPCCGAKHYVSLGAA
jgi:hypothetical protein